MGVYLFSPNLPAPINVGSLEQTKTGNLIIEGVLRLGQFTTANAPSGVEGALYFDTTENTTKIYSSSAWADLGSGAEPGQLPTYTTSERDALSPTAGLMIYNTDYDQVQTYTQTAWSGITGSKDLGIECASAMDCASGFCVDSVCCDTSTDNCSSDCEACNLVGYMGVCTVRANLDNTEVTTTCNYCNGVSETPVAYTGYAGVGCTGSNACFSGTCLASYCDEDNDAHYTTFVAQCPSGRFQSTIGDDCNDSCATCYPGSTATAGIDGLDQDCDGEIDETSCSASWTTCIYHASTCNQRCAALTDCGCASVKYSQSGNNYDCTVVATTWCNTDGWGYYLTCNCVPTKYH